MLSILVSNRVEQLVLKHGEGPLRLGREPKGGGTAQAIQDQYVSADQLLIEEQSECRVRLTNLSQRVRIELADGSVIDPGTIRDAPLPVRMTAGRTLIEVCEEIGTAEEANRMSTIARPLAGLGASQLVESPLENHVRDEDRLGTVAAAPLGGERIRRTLAELDETPGAERLARWFETLVNVQRAAACSDAFFLETARAVVNLIGLDCGLVLSRDGAGWIEDACYPPQYEQQVRYSRAVLELICRERRTYFQEPGACNLASSPSLSEVATVVASPIFSNDGEDVVGAVYGLRFFKPGRPETEIRNLEAQLVQVLAAAVGAGLARRESETMAARRYVQFEQFFSTALARELDRDPSLLEGRDREITILSSDIRGFSRIAENLGPRETCLLVNQVLERLTARVHEFGGVVIDYVGDGMMAMWNAPVDQPDHAVRACRAAQGMIAELPGLDERWHDRIGKPLKIGIGVNTGVALVGNTGSPQKFKYGPLGHAVNLASRVEGATKHFGVPILITGSTHERLGGTLLSRRLRRVRVAGIDGAVDLHELAGEVDHDAWSDRRDAYESGLSLFESGQFSRSCATLYPLLAGQEGRYDHPTLSLVASCIECLKSEPVIFDPVFDLIHK